MTPTPLHGARVVVLRIGADDDDPVAAALRAAGADARAVAVGEAVDRGDDEVLGAVGPIERFAWVAVTSRNGARRLALWALRWPAGTRVAAVGPATAAAARAAGVPVDAVAASGTGASLADAIDRGPVLVLAASGARDELPEALGRRGIAVTRVAAYDLVLDDLASGALEALEGTDAVVAMSPSTLQAMTQRHATLAALRGAALVAIGPSTAEAAEGLGLHPTVAATRTPEAVVAALAAVLGTVGPAAT